MFLIFSILGVPQFWSLLLSLAPSSADINVLRQTALVNWELAMNVHYVPFPLNTCLCGVIPPKNVPWSSAAPWFDTHGAVK
jgi:hypothetical protein